MGARGEFRQALISGDADLLMRMWSAWFPGKPQPANRCEAEIQLHMARTASQSVPLKLRAYSHRWLIERELPSLLPDELRPNAEQVCPKVQLAAGFSWATRSEFLKPAAPAIHKAVSERVNEMAADGLLASNPDGVRAEMISTKNQTLQRLFGRRTLEV